MVKPVMKEIKDGVATKWPELDPWRHHWVERSGKAAEE